MVVKQMHIQFNLGTQKIGSLSRRKFYPQEIDSLLNMAMEQWIKDSIRSEEDEHGFEQVQIDVDRLRNLIVRNYTSPAEYVETSNGYKIYNSYLPADYSYLVSDTWYHTKACSTNLSNTIPKSLFVIPVKLSNLSVAPYYAIAKLEMTDGVTPTILVQLDGTGGDTAQGTGVAVYTGYQAKEENFRVIELFREFVAAKSRNKTFTSVAASFVLSGLYYERYGDLYYPGQLLLVSNNSTFFPKITLDGNVNSIGGSTSLAFTQHSDASTYQVHASRLTKSSKVDNVLTTEYMKPLKNSPVSTIDNNLIRLYVHTSQIVNKGLLTYIRQPQKIDLTLLRNCELAPEFHQRIVDMAVEYAAGRLENAPLYEITSRENKSKQ